MRVELHSKIHARAGNPTERSQGSRIPAINPARIRGRTRGDCDLCGHYDSALNNGVCDECRGRLTYCGDYV